MPKAIYIPWAALEEDDLPHWLAQNRHLSWEEKAEKYTKDFGIPRSSESLRGKHNQLLKGIRRRRTLLRQLARPRRDRPRGPRRGNPVQTATEPLHQGPDDRNSADGRPSNCDELKSVTRKHCDPQGKNMACKIYDNMS